MLLDVVVVVGSTSTRSTPLAMLTMKNTCTVFYSVLIKGDRAPLGGPSAIRSSAVNLQHSIEFESQELINLDQTLSTPPQSRK